MSFIKNFIGVLGFILTVIILNLPSPDFSKKEIISLLFSGFIGVAIADLLFLSSLTKLGSGFSAIVATIYSPIIFLFSFLMFGESISMETYFGGILVICGIGISTFRIPIIRDKRIIIVGVLFGILAQVLTAYSVLLVKPIMKENSIVYIALYRFSIGLFCTVLFLFFKTSLVDVFKTLNRGLNTYTIILGSFLGTYLSVIFWLAGFKYTISGRAAIYNQLSTIFIILLAFFILKEPMSKKKWVGVLLSISGALIVSFN
jgi:drug/metabolite transporter (DMT)-like permease